MTSVANLVLVKLDVLLKSDLSDENTDTDDEIERSESELHNMMDDSFGMQSIPNKAMGKSSKAEELEYGHDGT